MPDVIASRLRVLFVGINPGLWSGAVGHHFARPGNRFWRVLHAAGFTVWVLPNPSGLNAHYQLPGAEALFRRLRAAPART